tara:strand:- start:2896 stop:3315 length:420 start_codon:yes stop_codon:yes gene_type:complete
MAIYIYNKVDGIEIDSGVSKFYIHRKNIKLRKGGNSITIYDDSNTSVALGQRSITFKYEDISLPVTDDLEALYQVLLGYLDGTVDPTDGNETINEAILNTSVKSTDIELNTNRSESLLCELLDEQRLTNKYLKKIYNPE